MTRIKKLAKSVRMEMNDEIWNNNETQYVSPAALNYCASAHILLLAKPKLPKKKFIDGTVEDDDINYDPKFETKPIYDFEEIEMPKQYQNIKSVGIKKLAVPKHKRKKFVKGSTPFQQSNLISKNAMKYVPTDNMLKLARPKYFLCDMPSKSNPFAVKRSAFKKIPKSKIKIFQKLATPHKRKCTKKFENR